MKADLGALQTFDGFDEQGLGVVLAGQQRLGGCDRTQSPVRSAAGCAFFEPGERRGGRFPVADMRGGFDEFEETPAVEAEVLVLATRSGSGQRLVVPSDTVEQNCGGIPGEADEAPFTLAVPSATADSISPDASAGTPRQAASVNE